MSVRYTATWYDVMQARQPAVTAICRPAGRPGRYGKESWRASTGGLKVEGGVGGGCVAHTPHTAHTTPPPPPPPKPEAVLANWPKIQPQNPKDTQQK